MQALLWRYVARRLSRHLPAEAVGPLLGDLAEDDDRRRR